MSASALVISPTMEKVPYDVARDFAPVTLVVTVPEMLVVASNVPANNMAELVALAKAQPGKLNFASAGVGGLPHLAGELFKLTAKIDIVHVPYRGAAPAINDLLGQQVQMAFLDLPVILLPQIKAGSLRPIALGARQRAPTAPDVPTTAEVGMPDLLIENWYGMIAPAKRPPAIVAALNSIANAAMADPAVKEKLADQGLTLAGDTPEHFREFIDAETEEVGQGDQDAGVARRSERSFFNAVLGGRVPDDNANRVLSIASAPGRVDGSPLCAALRRCSTSCFAGRGSVLKLRAQIASLRLAQGSRILIIAIGIDRAQRLGGGFRHHGDADLRRHHLADRVEIPQPRPKSQAQAEPRGMSGDMDLKRGGIGQPDEIAVGHLLKIDLAAVGKFVAPRRHQRQPVLAEQEPLDIVRQGMLGRKAEIGGTGHDRRGDIGAFTLLDIDVDIGMFAQKCRQRLRQMLRQPRGVGEQQHAGPDAAGVSGEIAAQGLDIVHDDAGMIEQAFAGRGQLDAAAAAL